MSPANQPIKPFFFERKLQTISRFYGETRTTILDFWIPTLACSEGCARWILNLSFGSQNTHTACQTPNSPLILEAYADENFTHRQ